MSYQFLGQNLHETADLAKRYFEIQYGAKQFQCESVLDPKLPLKPTWQAVTPTGYRLCVEVRETPFSNSLYEFVGECAARGMPVRLWVAIPQGNSGPTFNAELKQARNQGVGVVQIASDGSAHEFHRPVPLSLFALKKTESSSVPTKKRESIKNAESTFLDGTPEQGCQAICQELESVTRSFAEYTYSVGWWRTNSGSPALNPQFFQTNPWAEMLKACEDRIDPAKVKAKSGTFSKHAIVRVRGVTDWRN